MREKDPLEDLLNQIGDLIILARDKAPGSFVDKMPPEIGSRLSRVEDMVLALQKVSEEELQAKGMTRGDVMNKLFEERKQLPKRDQRMIEHSINLSRDALGLKFALQAAELKATKPANKPFDVQKAKESQIKKRKSKFKKMHGDSRWKKL